MKGRLRVLHVIDSLDLGGAQAVLINLIRYGDKSRFEFEIASMHGRGVYWDAVQSLGVPVHSLSINRFLPSYVPALIWLCLTRRYDIVHTHLLGANVIAKPIAAMCGVSVRINHDHCNDKGADLNGWAAKLDKATNRFSTHIIAVSESTRDYVVESEGVEPGRVTTIYNGIDLSIYKPRPEAKQAMRARYGFPPEAFVIAGVGRLSYQKNFTLFLDVAALVISRHPNAYFAIAGKGAEEASLQAHARTLGIESRVKFLGYVGDMPSLYPAIDMLLLTSRYEGLPITILEAMATGTVLVSSKLDGVQEVLCDGVDGALVAPGDAHEFARRIGTLIDQPQAVSRYRNAAMEKVRARFSAEVGTRAVETIYGKYLPQRT